MMHPTESTYPNLGPFPTTGALGVPEASAPPHEEAIALVDGTPEMQSPEQITQSIKESKTIDWKAVSLRALSFFSSVALGVLTGLAVAGTMATPVGWAIAGGALLIGLAGSLAYGGSKEFLQALRYSLSGFVLGFSIGHMVGVGPVKIPYHATYIEDAQIMGGAIGITAGLFGAAYAVHIDAIEDNHPPGGLPLNQNPNIELSDDQPLPPAYNPDLSAEVVKPKLGDDQLPPPAYDEPYIPNSDDQPPPAFNPFR